MIYIYIYIHIYIYIYILLPEQRLTGKISQKTWSSWLPNSSLLFIASIYESQNHKYCKAETYI